MAACFSHDSLTKERWIVIGNEINTRGFIIMYHHQKTSIFRLIIATYTLFSGAIGCIKVKQITSNIMHEANQPVQGDSPFLRYAPTMSDYLAKSGHLFQQGQILNFVAADHPLNQRLQYWIHQVHTEVLKTRPDVQATIPEPQILIFPATTPDAFITMIPVCLEAPLLFDTLAIGGNSSSNTPNEINEVLLDFDSVRHGFVNPYTWEPKICATTEHSSEIDTFITFYNSYGAHCQLGREGNAVRVKSAPGCTNEVNTTRAKRFAFGSAAAVVNLSTAMINMVESEDQLISIIVHELGHYYRANGVLSAVPGLYSYFFVEQLDRPAHKPTATSDSDVKQQQAERLSFNRPQQIGGSTLNPYVRNLALSLVSNHRYDACGTLTTGFCRTECGALYKRIQGIWIYTFNASQRIEAADQPAYLALENDLKGCVMPVEITAPTPNHGVGQLTMEDIGSALTNMKYAYLNPLAPAATLGEVLQRISDAATQLQNESDAFLASLVKDRLGFYTGEQESDEFSTEMLARIGIDPAAAARAFRVAMNKFEADPKTAELSAASNGITASECTRLADNNPPWTDLEAGTPTLARIPLGSFLDQHHGYCYRMFNITREINAHHWVAASIEHPASPISWDAMQQAASKATDTYVSSPQPMDLPLSRPADAPSQDAVRTALERAIVY